MEIAVIQQDPETGELFFEIPTQQLNQLGWYEGDVFEWFDNHDGDVLEWFDNRDGSWRIEKKHENKIVE